MSPGSKRDHAKRTSAHLTQNGSGIRFKDKRIGRLLPSPSPGEAHATPPHLHPCAGCTPVCTSRMHGNCLDPQHTYPHTLGTLMRTYPAPVRPYTEHPYTQCIEASAKMWGTCTIHDHHTTVSACKLLTRRKYIDAIEPAAKMQALSSRGNVHAPK